MFKHLRLIKIISLNSIILRVAFYVNKRAKDLNFKTSNFNTKCDYG